MRFFALTLMALLLTAGIASAQVAAPSLNPTPTFDAAPGNPAVLPWDGPSRVGLAYGTLSLEDNAGASIADGSVTALAAQWNGPTFSAGVGLGSISADIDPLLGGGSASIDAQVLVLAAQFADLYSLGFAYGKVDSADPGPNDETETLPLFGATVRLGQVFYLGLAAGTATLEDNLSPPDELKRSILNYGVAYLWRDKDRGLHAEYYHADREGVLEPVSGFNVDEEVISGYTLEGVYANFLFGYQSQTTDVADPAGVAQGSRDATTITVGYVPAPGWSIVAVLFSEDDLDTAGVVQETTSGTHLGVALRF